MTIYNAINNATVAGSRNSVLGQDVGILTNTSDDNSLLGNKAGHLITSNSSRNVFIGSLAGASLNGSNDATGIGYSALASSNANQNTAIGSNCLFLITSGFTNTAVGYTAGSAYTGNESSNVCLGSLGFIGESNALRLGNPFTGGSGVGEQLNCYIAGIVDNEQTDIGGYFLTLTEPVNSQIACINSINFPNTIVTTYNTPGTFTWTKNPKTQNVVVYGWSGGDGGGSGRTETVLGAGGGAGGAGGSSFMMECPAFYLDATETVIVGVGGAGGAPQSSSNSDGNPGSPGTPSSFGNFIPHINTTGGPGGTFGDSLGLGIWTYFNQQLWNVGGVSGTSMGGTGTLGDGQKGGSAGIMNSAGMSPSSGGGGGGIDTVNRLGGAGGDIWGMDSIFDIKIVGGTAGNASNGGNGNDGIFSTPSDGPISGGTGGGGAGSVGGTSGPAFVGGNGGFPGGGGGGGSGGLNGIYDSGAGGNGGNGLIIVLERF